MIALAIISLSCEINVLPGKVKRTSFNQCRPSGLSNVPGIGSHAVVYFTCNPSHCFLLMKKK